MKRSDTDRTIKMAELAVVDALIFQEILAASDREIDTISKCLGESSVKQALLEVWNKILSKNYAPIFEIGKSILEALPSSPSIENGLKRLATEAERMAASKALLRHDLMGRIYHRLLMADIAKYYATYYTSIPAACLLARLSLGTTNPHWQINWSKLDDVLRLKVGDLACGSGTLLSAVYRAMLDLYSNSSAEVDADTELEKFHKIMIESVLWGFDVLTYASHLSATTLALHNPSAMFKGTNIYGIKLVGKGDKLHLGSVDFLVSRKIDVSSLLFGGVKSAPERRTPSTAEHIPVSLPDFHLIIMNPPFTRSVGGNLLFGGLPPDERRALQSRLKVILKDLKISGIGQAGLGAVFVFVADRYLLEAGRLALVAPRSIISGVAWTKVRELLCDNYQLEYVIASHEAPNSWNFSENTDLSEVLLVARKRKSSEPPCRTVVVNLWRKPRNEMESIVLSTQLTDFRSVSLTHNLYDLLEYVNATPFALKIANTLVGEAYTVTENLVRDSISTWGQLAPFAQSELNRIAQHMMAGTLYSPEKGVIGYIPTIPLGDIFKNIGPDRSQVRGTFRAVSAETSYRAFWEHDSNYVKTLEMNCNFWLEPKQGKMTQAQSLWSNGSGKLMISERLWLKTNRLCAVHLPEIALSNVWWPTRLNSMKSSDDKVVTSEENELIQAMWLNSTPGIIGLLTYRQDTRGGWIGMKKETLRYVPLLDLEKLSRKEINTLIDTYNSHKSIEAQPFPQQFKDAADGHGMRKELDQTILECAMKSKADMKEVYRLLSKEPIICLVPLAKVEEVRTDIFGRTAPASQLDKWI